MYIVYIYIYLSLFINKIHYICKGFLPFTSSFSQNLPPSIFCLEVFGFFSYDLLINRKNETAGLLGRHPSWLATPNPYFKSEKGREHEHLRNPFGTGVLKIHLSARFCWYI